MIDKISTKVNTPSISTESYLEKMPNSHVLQFVKQRLLQTPTRDTLQNVHQGLTELHSRWSNLSFTEQTTYTQLNSKYLAHLTKLR